MTNKKEPKIEIKDLKFCHNGRVLLSVEYLSIDSPGITVIVGPNGAGKSLLLKLIQGIELPSVSIHGTSDTNSYAFNCLSKYVDVF